MAYKPQFKVKATYMRGGTSKGTFFNIADLPKECQEDQNKKNKLLQRIVGSPDAYGKQIDGMVFFFVTVKLNTVIIQLLEIINCLLQSFPCETIQCPKQNQVV